MTKIDFRILQEFGSLANKVRIVACLNKFLLSRDLRQARLASRKGMISLPALRKSRRSKTSRHLYLHWHAGTSVGTVTTKV